MTTGNSTSKLGRDGCGATVPATQKEGFKKAVSAPRSRHRKSERNRSGATGLSTCLWEWKSISIREERARKEVSFKGCVEYSAEAALLDRYCPRSRDGRAAQTLLHFWVVWRNVLNNSSSLDTPSSVICEVIFAPIRIRYWKKKPTCDIMLYFLVFLNH